MPSTKELIAEKFDELPEPARFAFSQVDFRGLLTDLEESHGLHIDQVGTLSDEIMLLAVGETDIKDFPKRVEKNLGLSSDFAQQVLERVNDVVLHPMREALKRKTEEEKQEAAEQSDESSAAGQPDLSPPEFGIAQYELPSREEEEAAAASEGAPSDALPDAPAAAPAKHAPASPPKDGQSTATPGEEEQQERQGAAETSGGEAAPGEEAKPRRSIAEGGLDGFNRLPKEERVVDESGEEVTKREEDAGGEEERKYPGGADPYREPVE